MSLSTGTRLRAAIAVVVVLVNALGSTGYRVLPWALLVVAMDLVTAFLLTDLHVLFRERRRLHPLVPTLAGAVCAGLALDVGASALPLVIIPAFRAGEQWGRRAALAAGLAWAGSAVAMLMLSPGTVVLRQPVSAAIWGGLAVSLGILAAWSTRLDPADRPGNPVADEAAFLLARLDDLAADLEGGLDPATSAELLLDSLGRTGPLARSAVLVGSGGDRPVPLALRGSERVPWPDPTTNTGVVGAAWRTGTPGSQWDPLTHRAVLAVPLRDTRGGQIGVLVNDVLTSTEPGDEVVVAANELAVRYGPMIGVALAFANLRERAGFEERERLAREMHDGIAQELVALGFQLDRIKAAKGVTDDQRAGQIDAARVELTRILGDLRSHITDLRVSVRPERGLGATMSSRLQQFGTTTGTVVSLRLSESGFRLPARAETALYQLFLDVLSDTKHSGATGIDVDLTVLAPQASLRIRHDGVTRLTADALGRHALAELGGRVEVSTHGGLDLFAELHASSGYASPVHVKHKVPQPS